MKVGVIAGLLLGSLCIGFISFVLSSMWERAASQIINPTVMQVTSGAFSTLPTCNAGVKGTLYIVTDALAPAFGAIVAAGGAVNVLVYCNQTNWIVI